MLYINIKKVGEPVKIWPDTEPMHKKCILVDKKTGTETEVDLHISEIELSMKLINLRDRINKSDQEMAMIILLIEAYGQHKYYQGYNEATPEDESI